MNILDIIILLCLILSVICGLRKGFIAQAVAIISIVLGTWMSFRFSMTVSSWLSQWIGGASANVLNIISFAVIMVAVFILLFLLGRIVESGIKIIMLGWLNRLLGAVFSLLKCILILCLAISVFEAINNSAGLVPESKMSSSVLYGHVENIAHTVFPYLKGLIS